MPLGGARWSARFYSLCFRVLVLALPIGRALPVAKSEPGDAGCDPSQTFPLLVEPLGVFQHHGRK